MAHCSKLSKKYHTCERQTSSKRKKNEHLLYAIDCAREISGNKALNSKEAQRETIASKLLDRIRHEHGSWRPVACDLLWVEFSPVFWGMYMSYFDWVLHRHTFWEGERGCVGARAPQNPSGLISQLEVPVYPKPHCLDLPGFTDEQAN